MDPTQSTASRPAHRSRRNDALLELAAVNKTYVAEGKPVQALCDVSLSMTGGEFVAVQGPSGCGKSTLLLTAGGLQRPDGGVVRVAGEDLYRLTADDRASLRARFVGFVFQQFHLVPYLNVLDNVLAAAMATRGPSDLMDAESAQARARELTTRFRLQGRVHHLPGELSTGERQRAALARALFNRPSVILADEPTGNLDVENSDIVLGYLREFAADGGAVLLVTHDDRAAGVADRRLGMQDGRLVEGRKRSENDHPE